MVDARSKNYRRDALKLEADLAESYRELGLAIDKCQRDIERGIHGQVKRVKDNVDQVRNFFDIPGHIGRYPWSALGIAAASGLLLGAGKNSLRGNKLTSHLLERLPDQVKSIFGVEAQEVFHARSRPANYSQGLIGAMAPLLLQTGIAYLQHYLAERKNKSHTDINSESVSSCAE